MVFQIISALIITAFYTCYFSKMFSQRKKGIKTNQLGKGKTGMVKFIELTLNVVTCIVPVAEIISIILDTVYFNTPVRIAGVCMGLAGVVVFAVSVLTMHDSWRAGVPETDKTELITGGIYQISRNPAFLGFDLVYTGMTLIFFNWFLFSVSVIAVIMIHLQIVNVEENFLLEAFGDDYLDYTKKVCRYIGRKK